MISRLWEKDTYTIQNFKYIINTYIREYDMSKANISILLSLNIISKDRYNYLYSLDKMKRQIAIGILIRDDKQAGKALSEGFKSYRRKFFEANNIQDNDVASIKKDAIYIINKIAHKTQFEYVQFISKNIYSSLYVFSKFEIYYYSDRVNRIEKIDIKGISDDKLYLHKYHFLDFLCTVFHEVESGSLNVALDIIQGFYFKYINLELEKEYYRNFDSSCLYIMKNAEFGIYDIQEYNKNLLDISNNRDIIRELYSYISNIIISKI